MYKCFLFILLFFVILTPKAFAGTVTGGITTEFVIPENAPEGVSKSVIFNVNNPPDNVYLLINNDSYIPGENSVGDILEISNIKTGKKFIFDSQCSTLKLPPLNLRKLLDETVFEQYGSQYLNFTFINKCKNSKRIDDIYILFKTDFEDIEPFLGTMVDTDYSPSVPTPTILPTPPVGGSSLNVPLFKQGIAPYNDNNPSWESEVFDHAGAGQFSCGVTMAQCGCATSSIAMVFNYHGITKLPDGNALNPGSLNTWLKNNNGYNRNLGVIWPVASALSKKAKLQNPAFQYDALEYDTDTSYSSSSLANDLQQGIPNILQVNAPGMHFIVAKGKTSNSFEINDPFFNRTSLTAYNNSAASVRRYVPSNTDLSYLTYIVDKNVEIVLKDNYGNTVAGSYLEYSPARITEESSSSESSAINVLYFAKPETGKYKVELYSPGATDFKLDEYIITEQGEVKTNTYSGEIEAGSVKEYNVNYDKLVLANNMTSPAVTFDILKSDIQRMYSRGKIKNKILYATLKLQAEFADRASKIEKQPFGNRLAILTLRTFQFEIKKYRGKLIVEEAYTLLYKDTESLIKSLQEDINGGTDPGGGSGS